MQTPMQIPTPQRGGERPGALAACAAMLVTLCVLHVFVFDRKYDFDDAYFADALDRQTLVDFLVDRYLHWSGRWPIDALAALLLDHMWIWRIVNVCMVLVLCACVARLGFGERMRPLAGTACAFVLLWCMPSPVLRDAAWWVSGSFNYLWPTAMGIAALVPLFDRRERGRMAWAGFVLAGSFGAYHEQVAVALLGIGLPRAAWLWRTKRLHRGDVVLLAAIAVNAAVNLFAPGLQWRFHQEIPRMYPTYLQLTPWDKALLGIDVVAKLARSSNVLLVMACGAVIALSRRVSMPRMARVGVIVSCLVLIGAMARASAFPSMLVAFALAGLIAGIALVVRDSGNKDVGMRNAGTREAAWFAWSLSIGVGTLAAMALSPTVHGSGSRTAFAACIALLVATCRLLVEVRERFGARAFAWVMGAAVVMTAARIVEVVAKAA